LLAHHARSSAALVRTYTERLGIALVILSARARDPRDLEQISAVGAARLWHVDDDYLNDVHVEETMAEARAEGFAIVATL
ncbi:carboxylate--amine ligase, partial [Paraburkholderia sp. SIMBA_009]